MARRRAVTVPLVHETEVVEVASLREHPRNYRTHPEDQLAHLSTSIREHGFYRNVVVTRDSTILAGHGVVQAALAAGLTEIPVVRLDIDADDPKALKILTGDNELAPLAEIDDRLLSELLRDVRERDQLLGTGYDDVMLANLIFVTRSAAEIASMDAAAAWVGLPGFENDGVLKIIVSCETEEDRQSFLQQIGATLVHNRGAVWSVWWPERQRGDPSSLRFEDETAEASA